MKAVYKGSILLGALLGLAGFTKLSHAAILAERCNGCSESQYQAFAANRAMAAGQAAGQRYVYDLANGNLRAFDIEREPNGSGGYLYFANPRELTGAQISAFNTIKSAVVANDGSSTFHYDISASTFSGFPYPTISGFDFAQSNAYRNNISAWLPGGSGSAPVDNLAQTVSAILNAAALVVLQESPITFTVTITFADGSKATYTFAAHSEFAQLIRLVDINGNTIPMTVQEAAPNTYNFPNGGGAQMADHLGNFLRIDFRGNICINGRLACVGWIDTDGAERRACEWYPCGKQ
ncbi:hypothetical protein [Dokdonella sp.]|jgi:hypothetical protein|uniref:hypothetical protein n=1 Tax=Dokdonella sp. TaxID=2291710 RepID=UPI003784D32F